MRYPAVLLLLALLRVDADASGADSLVNEAWKSWKGQSSETVERLFREALAADPSNTRAHVGLALLFSLESKPVESWNAYRSVLTTEKNFYPYIFATWLNPRFSIDMDDSRKEIISLHTSLADDPRADAALRAQSCEILGLTYRDQGDLDRSDASFERMKAIRQWTTIGPFDNVSASGFDRVFPPESEYDTSKTYDGKNGVPAKWFAINSTRPDGWIDHLRYFAHSQAVFYANTFVYSPSKQKVFVRVGTSGSLKAFLNDDLLVASMDENNNDLDTYVVETHLQEGWNRLLIKCGFSEITKCNFLVRITDAGGKPFEGSAMSTAPRSYVRSPGEQMRVVNNFAETYFEEQIRLAPERFENYVLLADCYLRNDKAIEAELVLRRALQVLPDCPVLLMSMMEAYLRGEKYDEVNQTLDRVLALDPGLPSALEYKLTRALSAENFDEAQDVLRQMNERDPGSELYYRNSIAYYSKRTQIDRIIEVNAEALKRHPDNWNFVYLAVAIDIQTTQKYGTAIERLDGFLKKHYTIAALLSLADCYLKSSRFDKWETTFDRLFKHDPCAPGLYFKMEQVYSELQQYPKAERALESCIDICPNSSQYWSELGNIYRSMKDNAKASAAYRTAIRFNPADYVSRESLRDIEGKKSIFSRFTSLDVDSLVRSAPAAAAYPNDKGVVLLDDRKRVVFEQGASMSSGELLVRLFKPSGIDDFKEYQIGYNPNTEVLIVEKAVSIKKNKSQVKADVDKGRVVFKSLEEGDCVYLKWKVKNYYSGKLSNHFWDTQYFNGAYPVRYGRYALLVPASSHFRHQAQNMPDNPRTATTEDGVLYEWTHLDEPAIKQEESMPGLDDIGKILYVSSIPSWEYLVDWYSDLAQTKTRSSFEIREKVEQLFAGKSNLSEEQKIRIVYEFITENIRYSFVSFRQSGLVPQKARDVLVSRLGDCKDVATLCLAMLKEVGIDAHYVLVNTTFESENRMALPGIIFNHCIVAVNTKNGDRYLDLTANNYPMGSVPLGDIGAFSLKIASGPQTPRYLSKKLFTPSSISRVSSVVVNVDNSISVKRVSTRSGAASVSRRSYFRFKGEEEREKILTESLSNEFPNLRVKSLTFTNLDEPANVLIDAYEFDAPGFIAESGGFRLMRIPWSDNTSAVNGLAYDKRTYQYNFWEDTDTVVERIEIKLPGGYTPMEIKPAVRYSSPTASYSRTLLFSKGVLRGTRQWVQFKREVSPAEYASFKEFYNKVVKEDNAQILLKRK